MAVATRCTSSPSQTLVLANYRFNNSNIGLRFTVRFRKWHPVF
jgi:hypothetical protein